MLPLTSVTVIVTVLVPTCEQSQTRSGLKAIVAIPQLSLDPLSTSATEIDPLPDPSRVTVTGLQRAVGSSVS